MSAPKLTLKNLKLYMTYDFEPEDCKICKSNLCAPTPQELTNNSISKLDLVVIEGECGHIFHKKCIYSLKKNNYASCPSCNVVWRDKDFLKSNISVA